MKRRWMLRLMLWAALLALTGCSSNLRVSNARTYAAPSGGETIVEFRLDNGGPTQVVITGVRVADAEEAYFAHIVSYENPGGVGGEEDEYERAEPSPPVEIPARTSAEFHHNGRFIIVRGLRRALQAGDRLRVTLLVKPGGKFTFEAEVLP